ncbi:MAG TPA: aldolase/citrate lyase family protein [Pirellulales bacterium]|nr:aldolase/citrate lyase family protein [Pirellulales bacterium]
MNTPAIKKLRQTLAADQPAYGLWVTLESASITEMAVALGVDWVVIDAEHGHLDWKDILAHLRTTVRSETVALVRIAELNVALIKRALDIGADGVVVPWIESVEQVRQAVAFAHYPPDGRRGIGAERATCWGSCFGAHVAEADEHVLVVPIIESVRAGRDIESLCQVPGVEMFFIGPADYSSTAGYPGQWEGPGVAEQILHVKDVVRRHGKHCGLLATSNENLIERREQGFRVLGLGLDGGLLLRSLTGALATVGRQRRILPTFEPENQPHPAAALPAASVPDTMKADRREAMNPLPAAARVEIERGVIFRPLVGAHNQARNLTTGIVNFMPGAELPYHTHPHAEAVTVLQGRLAFEVEGRRYVLGPLDNIYVSKELAHHAANLSANQPAVVHIAMASHAPSRTLVERDFARREMGDDAAGAPGAERVNRHATTAWYEPNPGARFQDFYNRDLGCPEMSGGYGLFQPGGRLPCHIHDFDESISIIQGTATCVVDGHRYSLANHATALCPRGTCHYFINDTREPMAMLWVYAGPLPQRLVMREACCHPANVG